MYNFLDPKLMPKVQCSAPATDNYEASNLISENEAIRARGFLAYTVTQPPVDLEFEFLCSVDISHMILHTSIGNQKCTGIEVFAKTEASSYVSIAKAVYDTAGITFCTSKKYSKTNVPPRHDSTNALFFFKSDTIRVFTNVKLLKVVIFRTNRTVPCLASIKVFGKPARSCSQTTIATIDRIMGRSAPRVASSRTSDVTFKIPDDFIDDLTCEVMAVPMTLPSGKTIDRDTLDKHVESEKSFGRKPGDPFTGLKFTENRKPVMNVALKSRIDMFLMRNSGNPVTFGLKRTLGNDQVNGTVKKSRTNVHCCACQQEQSLYVLPCQHYYCRQCLLTLETYKCSNCGTEFTKSDAVLLYLNSYYFGLFAVCEIGMNIVKYMNFTDIKHFATDFGILMGVCAIELFRVILARKGNLTERKWPVLVAIFLTVPSLCGVLYLMIWQTHILRFEYIICGIQVGLQFVEIITGILCLLPFCKTPEYY